MTKVNAKEYSKKYREKNREKYRKVCLSHYYKRKKELAEIRKKYANSSLAKKMCTQCKETFQEMINIFIKDLIPV